jgi:hypothetical protein
MQPPLPKSERLIELLVSRITQGVSSDEQSELNQLIVSDSPGQDVEGLNAIDFAAGFAEMAFMSERYETIPDALRSSLIESGIRSLPTVSDSPTDSTFETTGNSEQEIKRLSMLRWQSRGWIAAAAMFIIALVSWWPSTTNEKTPYDQRQQLLSSTNDVQTSQWAVPQVKRFSQVKGDVVWSDTKQAGFMRLTGMPINDPGKTQYQLWIVDPTRYKYPIDGGVFDIDSRGEVIIPIDAKLKTTPTVFAITEEKPGGVVVSAGPLLVVAKTGT